MNLDVKILDVIACPICKGKLHYDKDAQTLICKYNKVSFPIKDGVPMLSAEYAKTIALDDLEKS
ncbi:MAG: Trm112 family protein [Gammaproteobacteria bacterium]|nr:Trm112 family protein [Gammaproteobacteria bacterium]